MFLTQASGFPAMELAYLSAAVDHLRTYLISDVLLWPLVLPAAARQRGPLQCELTLGEISLSVKSLEAAHSARLLSPAQSITYCGLVDQLADFRSKWEQAWLDKALTEYQARLRPWGQYIQGLAHNPQLHWPQYQTEITQRVALELLQDEIPDHAGSMTKPLSELDQRLVRMTATGSFLWPVVLERCYPPDLYWFLYCSYDWDRQNTMLSEG